MKLVVWDLDDTLWDGTYLSGEKIRVPDEVRRAVVKLHRLGILQSVISKNPPEVLSVLKETGLHDYFIYPQVNWNWKPINMERLISFFRILPKDVVFIDDQESERAMMKARYPEMLCVDRETFLELVRRIRGKKLTKDDLNRYKFFRDEERRMRELYGLPPEEFIKRLEMRIVVRKARKQDFDRVYDLYNKTNRLNATGERYEAKKVEEYMIGRDRIAAVIEGGDRFGSYGLIGVAFARVVEEVCVDGMAVSCRVIDRNLLPILLSYLLKAGRRDKLRIKVRKTQYNEFMRQQLEKFNPKKEGEMWIIKKESLKIPDGVKVDERDL